METAEQCVKSVQSSIQIVASDKVSALLLVLLQKEDFLEDYMEDTWSMAELAHWYIWRKKKVKKGKKENKSHQITCSGTVLFQITFIGLFSANFTTWFKLRVKNNI